MARTMFDIDKDLDQDIVLVIAKIVLYLWWQDIAVLRKKYFSVVNPPPQTM